MSEIDRIYWDSNVWLGLLNQEADKVAEIEQIYDMAKDGQLRIFTSVFTLLECRRLKHEVRPFDPNNEALVSSVFNQEFVVTIDLTSRIANETLRIWRDFPSRWKYQDAIHVASATQSNIETMVTYDPEDLLENTQKFNCRNGQPLNIIRPDDLLGDALFKP